MEVCHLLAKLTFGPGRILAPLLQLDRQQRDSLINVVMKFPGDPSAFLFVGLNQLAPHIGQSFLGQLAIRDVDARSYVARKRATRIKPRHTDIEEPPVISVVPAETILHLESLAAIEGSLIDIEARLEILRVHHLCPAVANLRIYGATCEIQPGLIEVRAQFVSPGHPDHHRRGVCDQAEPFFTFAQLVLCLLAVRDIDNHTYYALQVALIVEECSRSPLYPLQVAIVTQ